MRADGTRRVVPQGTLWVCINCATMHANGEGSVDPDPNEPEPWAREPETDVTMGLLRSEHDDGCDPESECSCEHREFSWAQCDGCGSTLGGSREAFTWWA